jgi:hypothetical protein
LDNTQRIVGPVEGLKRGHRRKIGVHRIQIHGIFPSLRPIFGTRSISQKEMKKGLNKPLKRQVFCKNSVKMPVASSVFSIMNGNNYRGATPQKNEGTCPSFSERHHGLISPKWGLFQPFMFTAWRPR